MRCSWADAAQIWLAEEQDHSAERDKLVSALGPQALGCSSGSLWNLPAHAFCCVPMAFSRVDRQSELHVRCRVAHCSLVQYLHLANKYLNW